MYALDMSTTCSYFYLTCLPPWAHRKGS